MNRTLTDKLVRDLNTMRDKLEVLLDLIESYQDDEEDLEDDDDLWRSGN